MSTPADPFAVLRTRKYAALLITAAILGVAISFLVYWFPAGPGHRPQAG